MRSGLLGLATLALMLLVSGCAGVVTRPEGEPPADARPVLLLDHGRHSSLVLTRSDHSLVRYLYGDWRWYAERDTGVLRVLPTLFAPTLSALGRRELSGPPGEDSVRRQIPVHIQRVHVLAASAERIDALDLRLSAQFAARAEALLFNPDYDLEFIPGPRPYTLFDNSNHMVADWLEELGIVVRGNPVFGRWRVRAEPR